MGCDDDEVRADLVGVGQDFLIDAPESDRNGGGAFGPARRMLVKACTPSKADHVEKRGSRGGHITQTETTELDNNARLGKRTLEVLTGNNR